MLERWHRTHRYQGTCLARRPCFTFCLSFVQSSVESLRTPLPDLVYGPRQERWFWRDYVVSLPLKAITELTPTALCRHAWSTTLGTSKSPTSWWSRCGHHMRSPIRSLNVELTCSDWKLAAVSFATPFSQGADFAGPLLSSNRAKGFLAETPWLQWGWRDTHHLLYIHVRRFQTFSRIDFDF